MRYTNGGGSRDGSRDSVDAIWSMLQITEKDVENPSPKGEVSNTCLGTLQILMYGKQCFIVIIT